MLQTSANKTRYKAFLGEEKLPPCFYWCCEANLPRERQPHSFLSILSCIFYWKIL